MKMLLLLLLMMMMMMLLLLLLLLVCFSNIHGDDNGDNSSHWRSCPRSC